MGEKDIERKSPGFWSFDILWLVPWLVFDFCWLYFLRENQALPQHSICHGTAFGYLHVSLKRVLTGAGPFIGVTIIWCITRRWHLRKLWHAVSILGLGLALLGIFGVWQSTQYIDEDYECRVLGDCRNISDAIMLFHKDTGEWPYYCSPFDDPDREPCIDYLYGNMGDMPDLYEPAWETWGTVSDDMYFHLVLNGRERPLYRPAVTGPGGFAHGWKGPYLPYVTDDPWSNRYLVSVGAFEGGRLKGSYVWCISAGPNECLETPTTAAQTQGDDIGYRTK